MMACYMHAIDAHCGMNKSLMALRKEIACHMLADLAHAKATPERHPNILRCIMTHPQLGVYT